MRIEDIVIRREGVPLTRPYAIASHFTDSVEIFYVAVRTASGLTGYGAASPVPAVTGETGDACAAALERGRSRRGTDASRLGEQLVWLGTELASTPAARAALDMALHDLVARRLGVPLCALLGAPRAPLPTSVTIGILPVDETLAEAREHVGRGFTCLKVKIGEDPDEDLRRLHRLREVLGPQVSLRVDANQGYDADALGRLLRDADVLGLELIEQPLARGREDELRLLDDRALARIALDESVHTPKDAALVLETPAAAGCLVVKLMKCGGVAPAREIAAHAATRGATLMWGCMDESVVSIAAALHVAMASPATRYLDLDGSFDLARDLATGGFGVEDGVLVPNGEPGLGVVAECFLA